MAFEFNGGPWGNEPESNDPWGKNKRKKTNGDDWGEIDIDEFLKAGNEKIKKLFPGGSSGGKNSNIFMVALGVLFLLWLSTGIYTVDESEEAAVLRFGKWVRTTGPGWNYHLPFPIESVTVKNVRQVNTFTNTQRGSSGDIMAGEGSLMLTGDENIADVQYVVNWRITDLGKFLFKATSPIPTIEAGADSVVREIISQTPIAKILSEGRAEINPKLESMLQALLNEYDIGVQIMQVKLLKVAPPTQKVVEAYLDVQRAKADMERKKNEAIFYRNSVVPVARGDAKKMIQDAEAYKSQIIADAQGETQRFLSILKEYKQNPKVARTRLYYQTMENVLSGASKVIADQDAGSKSGVVPYLPLPELNKAQTKKEGA